MKIILLTLLALSVNGTKVRIIDVEVTMEKATTRQLITVYGYKGDAMLYGISSSKDTLKIDSHLKEMSESNRLLLIEAKAMAPTDLAGKWPEQGEKLLMVIDGSTLLFAKTEGTDYRFWDVDNIPFTNSVFFMKKNGNYRPVGDYVAIDKNTIRSIDGFLATKEYINKKYNLK